MDLLLLGDEQEEMVNSILTPVKCLSEEWDAKQWPSVW